MKKILFLYLIILFASIYFFSSFSFAEPLHLVENVKFYKFGKSEKISFFFHRKIPEFRYLHFKSKRKFVLVINRTILRKKKLKIPYSFKYIKSISLKKTFKKKLKLMFSLTDKFSNINIYPLRNPNRIVVSIRRKKYFPMQRPFVRQKDRVLKNSSIQKNLRLKFLEGKGVIVIDPGHGGRDPGAIGQYKNNEKSINLDVSMRLFKILKNKYMKINKIFLTRNNDRYVSLNQRRRFSNRKNADLFISIHSNSSRRKSLNGIETYFYNRKASSKRSYRLALRENLHLEKLGTNLNKIFNDMWESEKIIASKRIAELIQKSLIKYLRLNRYSITDLGIKYAPFAVLKNSRRKINKDLFPPVSILVEIGFLSNKIESRRLSKPIFRQKIAEGIALGIKSYIMN